MPAPPLLLTSPLYEVRCLLGPRANARTGQPAPIYWMAAHLGVAPGTWLRAEADIMDCNVGTLDTILRGLRKLGVDARPDHLWGLAEWPDLGSPVEEARHPESGLPEIPNVMQGTGDDE